MGWRRGGDAWSFVVVAVKDVIELGDWIAAFDADGHRPGSLGSLRILGFWGMAVHLFGEEERRERVGCNT